MWYRGCNSFVTQFGSGLAEAIIKDTTRLYLNREKFNQQQELINQKYDKEKELLLEKATKDELRREQVLRDRMALMEKECEIKEMESRLKVQMQHNLYNEKISYEQEMSEIRLKEYLGKKEIDSRFARIDDGTAPNEIEGSGYKESIVWENFNDAVYNHPEEEFQWLLGYVFLLGSINLLIGPKSQGKTLLLTQMMDAISKGIPFHLLVPDNCREFHLTPQNVYLFDLEMQYAQLSERNGKHGYVFENIQRSTCQTYSVESFLNQSLNLVKNLSKPATIVVDNITRFISDITQPTIAKRLYNGIKSIRDKAKKRGIDITFILVAHTSNDWSEYNPITLKSIAVADSLTTGMDCICAIGPTRNSKQKMFKIITGRNIPPHNEVTILERKENPFVSFNIVGTANEADVLPTRKPPADNSNRNDIQNRNEKDIEGIKIPGGFSLSEMEQILIDQKSGFSLRHLAAKWKKSTTTINKAIKQYVKYLEQQEASEANSESSYREYAGYDEIE